MSQVEVTELTKSFGSVEALKALSFTLGRGKRLGLVGPDGAGKTTLLRLMAALLLPTSGSIKIGGFDTRFEAEQIHNNIGYMPQRFGLYEDLTVEQNLSLYASLRGATEDRRASLLAFTGLNPFTDRLAGDLSGGMKQKLGLACVLLKKPNLLLLDEPSVGVDPLSRRDLWQMVSTLVEEGISVVWSTSYLDEAEKCDEVLLLNEGACLYKGKPVELTDRMQGRTYLWKGVEGNRRHLLEAALENKAVLDGVIQGSAVRIVTEKGQSFVPSTGYLEPVSPRFEDAFIDILGRPSSKRSVLIEAFEGYEEVTTQAVIDAEGLTKRFGSFTAASDITFSVGRGEIFGLLGPNGAGKSTTFKMLCGLLKPTSGKAFVMGLNLQTAPGAARQKMGYMAQKFSLYGDLSANQNLSFFAGIYRLKGDGKKEVIEKMTRIFALKPYLEVKAGLLPLGFKQRLALSCALMHKPDVLFLDEPTSGVDPLTRREFWGHINALVDKGVTVMITTHFMDEAEGCDRIALVYQSRIIHMGTPEELKALAKTKDNPSPTLEEAFIDLILRS